MPSNLRSYLAYTSKLKQDYGSVMRFVLEERLGWSDLTASDPTPFAEPGAYHVGQARCSCTGQVGR